MEIDLKAFKPKKRKKQSDPFQDLDEDQIDDCFEELFYSDDVEGELKIGYKCTRKQALFWLKKKYINITSYGEELYEKLKHVWCSHCHEKAFYREIEQGHMNHNGPLDTWNH